MIRNIAEVAQPVLNFPYIRRIRRNHGLEHATAHMLATRINNLAINGRSDAGGFWLMCEVEQGDMEWAVNEALRRLSSGEEMLAVHPNCGTGLVTTAVMASMAGVAGSIGMKRNVEGYMSRLPMIILLTIGAIWFSHPVGLKLQEHFTTSGDPGDLEVLGVKRESLTGLRGEPISIYRVNTTSS